MFCKDCEQEVDKLISSTNTCKPCYTRWQNCKYRGVEYIPLKDIKGTNEYNRAMGKRAGAQQRKENKESVKTKENPIIRTNDPLKLALEQIQAEVRQELKETLDKEMTKRGVSPIVNTISLVYVLPALYDLFQENGYIKQRKILEAIYQNQIVDSLHILKQNNKDDLFLDIRVGSRQRQLQELRTPNKYELELYECYSDFIEAVKADKTLMQLLLDANEKYCKTLANQEDPVYITNSEFMKDYDFAVVDETRPDRNVKYNDKIDTIKYKYRVRIKNCKGLFGSPVPQTFIYKDKNTEKETYIEAPTAEDAKNIIKALMRNYFTSVKYDPADIEVISWEQHLRELKEGL